MDSGSTGAATRQLSSLLRVGTVAGLGDRVLLERFADRRGADDEAAEAAFAALVERHGPMVLRVCRAVLGDRHEAEDAFQATFLILASRARSIRRGDSVASWLHGVALRVAGRARRGASRRRRHERRHAEMSSTTGIDPTGSVRPFDDVEGILHEEIGRLPEKYRRPVVLCYLEGLTHDQAADRLGWPVGTVRRRLAGARDRLRGRLTRRGVAPVLVSSWESVRPAVPVPSRLAEVTVRGALRVGTGKAALAGIVSAESITLMKGVTQSMTTIRLVAMAAAVLAVGLVTTGVGLLAYSGPQPTPQGTPAQAKGQEKPGSPDAADRSPDEQLDALLRQYDEAIETNQKIVIRGASDAERRAQVQKIQGVNGPMLELAIRHPRTNAAEQALVWLVTNRGLEPEAKKAWEILARDHVRSDRLKQVFSRQVEVLWASRAAEDLLRSALEQNPYREIRGLACYWLAELLKYRAESLRNWSLQPPEEAERWRGMFRPQDFDRIIKQDPRALEHRVARLYDRVITEFPWVRNNDLQARWMPPAPGRAELSLADVANVRLDVLRRLSVGKPAPEIGGVDLDGRPMTLSHFRGKVVVLAFPGYWIPLLAQPDRAASNYLESFRRLAPIIAGKPVVMLGVVAHHREEHRQAVRASGLPVRLWWDPNRPGTGGVGGDQPGPIATAWCADLPTLYVIDPRGVIRYTHIPAIGKLEKAVAAVLKEPDGGPGPK